MADGTNYDLNHFGGNHPRYSRAIFERVYRRGGGLITTVCPLRDTGLELILTCCILHQFRRFGNVLSRRGRNPDTLKGVESAAGWPAQD